MEACLAEFCLQYVAHHDLVNLDLAEAAVVLVIALLELDDAVILDTIGPDGK